MPYVLSSPSLLHSFSLPPLLFSLLSSPPLFPKYIKTARLSSPLNPAPLSSLNVCLSSTLPPCLCLILHFLPRLSRSFAPSLLRQPSSPFPLRPLEYHSFSFSHTSSLRGITRGPLVRAGVCLQFTGAHLGGGGYMSTRGSGSLKLGSIQIFVCEKMITCLTS